MYICKFLVRLIIKFYIKPTLLFRTLSLGSIIISHPQIVGNYPSKSPEHSFRTLYIQNYHYPTNLNSNTENYHQILLPQFIFCLSIYQIEITSLSPNVYMFHLWMVMERNQVPMVATIITATYFHNS